MDKLPPKPPKHPRRPKPDKTGPKPPPPPKFRYDWYQTDQAVIITVFVKNIEKLDIEVKPKNLVVSLAVGTEELETALETELAHSIDENNFSYKTLPTKVEINLPKMEAIQWETLNGKTVLPPIPMSNLEDTVRRTEQAQTSDPLRWKPASYWEKLETEVKDIDDEQLEGDQAINKLFQQIYREGDDEVKKAMNKSFIESKGTVLSTNWSNVKQGEVETKPPDGMEWKKY